MTRFAKGFRPDAPGRPYLHQVHALGASGISLPNSDLTPYRAGRVYQGHVGDCFEQAPKRALQLLDRILHPKAAPLLVSDIAHYAAYRHYDAHLQDPAATPEQLPTLAQIGDTGGVPYDAMLALQQFGLVLERDWPGPASGRRDWDAMLETDVTDDVLVRAYDARGVRFVKVDMSHGIQTAVRVCHPAGVPVMVAINADPLSVDPGEEVVKDLPTSGQNHYVAVISGNNGQYALLDNWWDDHDGPDGPWGIQSSDQERGCWRCDWDTLNRAVSDVLGVTGLPTTLQLRKAA